jgi:asparagine synthetase A
MRWSPSIVREANVRCRFVGEVLNPQAREPIVLGGTLGQINLALVLLGRRHFAQIWLDLWSGGDAR